MVIQIRQPCNCEQSSFLEFWKNDIKDLVDSKFKYTSIVWLWVAKTNVV